MEKQTLGIDLIDLDLTQTCADNWLVDGEHPRARHVSVLVTVKNAKKVLFSAYPPEPFLRKLTVRFV
jgi:hypothetical protein